MLSGLHDVARPRSNDPAMSGAVVRQAKTDSSLRRLISGRQLRARPSLSLVTATLLGLAMTTTARSEEATIANLALDVEFSCGKSGPQLRAALQNASDDDLIMRLDQLPLSTTGGVMEFEFIRFGHLEESSRPLFEPGNHPIERGFVVLP